MCSGTQITENMKDARPPTVTRAESDETDAVEQFPGHARNTLGEGNREGDGGRRGARGGRREF